MGFFNKDTATGALAPLDGERIKKALEARSWKYSVDSDGDIGASWDDGFFYFLPKGEKGEILYVRGAWFGKLAVADLPKALEVCNNWSQETFWPRAFARVDTDEQVLRIHTEHTVDYEHGLTDDQLVQHLVCVVSSSMQFFEKLAEEFPAAAEAYRAESS